MSFAQKIDRVRTNSPSTAVASARIMAGAVVAVTGVMKYTVPSLNDAWSGQLQAANLPLYWLTYVSVPAVEIVVGLALALGWFARAAALVIASIMLVATYVHLTVDDPALFPLQPHAPVIPLAVFAMAALVVWRGAGSGNADLRV